MDFKQGGSLHLCQINVSGLSQRSITTIDKFNSKYNNDILALQETLLDSTRSHLNIFQNLDTFSLNNSRGVSTSVAPRLCPQQIGELQDSICDALWVTVRYSSGVLMVGNIYVNHSPSSPNSLTACRNNILKALQYCTNLNIKDVVIVGDFNSRHVLWGDSISNDRGKQLTTFISQQNLTCISPNTNTFVSSNGGSVIDLALLKGRICGLYHSSSVDHETELFTGAPTRGHLPVIHQFKCPAKPRSVSLIHSKLYWDTDKTDWNKWRNSLSRALTQHISPRLGLYSDPAKLWNDFIHILQATNKQNIPVKKVCQHSKPFWNPLLSDLSAKLQTAQAAMRMNYSPLNVRRHTQAKEEFSEALIAEKNNWIHQQLENLNVADSPRFWKNYKRILTDKANDYMGNLMDKDILYSKRIDKENILYKSFFSGEHMSEGNFDHAFEQEIDIEYDSITRADFHPTPTDPIIDEHLNGEISLMEVINALQSQKSTAKSFDADELHPKILKHLPTAAIHILKKLFNLVLNTGVWVWDVSNVTFIKKDGKDNYMIASAYRPITISSYIGKLLEKVIEKRIKIHCEIEGILDEEQEGFRSKRNTSRYLYKLIATLDECKKKKLTTFLLCIDFSKAFDSIWIKGLIVKLCRYQLQGKLLKTINNFLLSRQVRLKVDRELGQRRSCGWFGLPQGSVLAPLLFILYIADLLKRDQLPTVCNTYSSLFKYADDGTIAVSHQNPLYAHGIMLQMCKYLHIWCSKWKLIPNCDKNKTECLIIQPSSSLLHTTNFQPLKIGDKGIMYASSSRVLGLTIDDNLSFQDHARSKLKQCWFAWHRITRKCTRIRGLNCSSLSMLFKTVVLTKLLYAAPIWLKHNLPIYKDFYARVLLKISGATHHPPKELTSVALNIPPLEISYQMITTKFIIKALTSDHHMQGLVLQLEEAKAHRYYEHIDLIRKFLSWKTGESRLNRSRIDLLEGVQKSIISYSREEISQFLEYTWNEHLQMSRASTDLPPDTKLLGIENRSKKLFPRHSRRSTDTKVMSLLHGHDLCFNAFNATVTGNCDPNCTNCSSPDNNFHRILSCTLYNSSYRDALHHHFIRDSSSWPILRDGSGEDILAFRCLAQLAITDSDLTCR